MPYSSKSAWDAARRAALVGPQIIGKEASRVIHLVLGLAFEGFQPQPRSDQPRLSWRRRMGGDGLHPDPAADP